MINERLSKTMQEQILIASIYYDIFLNILLAVPAFHLSWAKQKDIAGNYSAHEYKLQLYQQDSGVWPRMLCVV